MKIPVLYGSELKKDFSGEAKYVGSKLALQLTESWDGNSETEFPETDEKIRSELLSFLKEDDVSFDTRERFLHSMGKSSPEILLAKHGLIGRIVDAVVYPSHGNAASILLELRKRDFRAIVFGGGTSVSGSLLVEGREKTVSLDTSKLTNVTIGDHYAILGAGLRGPDAEKAVNVYGYTLGSFPESFRHSTLGGWVSTKAVGQESNQYGGIENLVLGVRMATSSGEITDRVVPRESTGLSVRDMALGSDGRYGLITEVIVRLFQTPRRRYYSSRIYRSFKDGIDALARTARFPSVARLSDETETEFALMGAGDSALVKLFRRYVSARGYRNGALLVVVNNDVDIRPITAFSMSGGSQPARSWIRGRFERPGIANVLWKNGLVPDTLETSAPWSALYGLYRETRNEFYSLKEELGFTGEIMAHVSHLYREGACVYFTFIIGHENEIEVLDRVRDSLIRTFISNGGAITHHHGYGRYFSGYMNPGILELQEKLSDPLFRRGD